MPRVISFEDKYKKKPPPTPEELEAKKKKQEEWKTKCRANLQIARAKAQALRALKKEKEMSLANSMVKAEVAKLEKSLDERIMRNSAQAIKAAFYIAFEESGGQKGLVKWVKESPRHRLEFYKILASIIRQSDEDKQVSGNKIVVNILGLDQNNKEIVISENTLQIQPKEPVEVVAEEVVSE